MDCHYHPGRESETTCTVCGKPICAECSMEIAGKTYCKDCLEKIIGMNEPSINQNVTPSNNPISDTLQEMNPQYDEYYEKEIPTPSFNEEPQTREDIIGDVLGNKKQDLNDSPYALNNFETPNIPTPDYNSYDNENLYQQESPFSTTDDINSPNNYSQMNNQLQQFDDDDFIYPDHSYQPHERENNQLDSKYENYLDDLYIDEPEIPLSEQIARDEEFYGSLTKNPYEPQIDETYYQGQVNEYDQYIPQTNNYQEQGFLNISDVAHNNPQGDFVQQQIPPRTQQPNYNPAQSPRQRGNYDDGMKPSTRSIHNIRNMESEKEPYGAVDIILTIILVILVILVIFYIIYLFILSSSYPTFADALYGLTDPGTFFANLSK